MREILLCWVCLVRLGASQKLCPAVVGLSPLLEEGFCSRKGGGKPQCFFKVLG